jgi:hypothetical protein
MNPSADSGPNFLLDWHESGNSRRYWRAGIGSLVVHAGIFAMVLTLASLSGPLPRQATEIVPDFGRAVTLVAPRDLTQKAPNRGKVAKEVNVEDLKPRPAKGCLPHRHCAHSSRRFHGRLDHPPQPHLASPSLPRLRHP